MQDARCRMQDAGQGTEVTFSINLDPDFKRVDFLEIITNLS